MNILHAKEAALAIRKATIAAREAAVAEAEKAMQEKRKQLEADARSGTPQQEARKPEATKQRDRLAQTTGALFNVS
ncbi:unnamed protein product [Ascophyllum nodosum]